MTTKMRELSIGELRDKIYKFGDKIAKEQKAGSKLYQEFQKEIVDPIYILNYNYRNYKSWHCQLKETADHAINKNIHLNTEINELKEEVKKLKEQLKKGESKND